MKFLDYFNQSGEQSQIEEAFNTKPYETTFGKKSSADVYWTFFDEDGQEFRIQFYSASGIGKDVRQVFIGQKKGNLYLNVLTKFLNPMRVIATLIDATQQYLKLPIGQSIKGFAIVFAQKSLERGLTILPKILRQSVIKTKINVMDLKYSPDPSRGYVWVLRKGEDPAQVFNGDKMKGITWDDPEKIGDAPPEAPVAVPPREVSIDLGRNGTELDQVVVTARFTVEPDGKVTVNKFATKNGKHVADAAPYQLPNASQIDGAAKEFKDRMTIASNQLSMANDKNYNTAGVKLPPVAFTKFGQITLDGANLSDSNNRTLVLDTISRLSKKQATQTPTPTPAQAPTPAATSAPTGEWTYRAGGLTYQPVLVYKNQVLRKLYTATVSGYYDTPDKYTFNDSTDQSMVGPNPEELITSAKLPLPSKDLMTRFYNECRAFWAKNTKPTAASPSVPKALSQNEWNEFKTILGQQPGVVVTTEFRKIFGTITIDADRKFKINVVRNGNGGATVVGGLVEENVYNLAWSQQYGSRATIKVNNADEFRAALKTILDLKDQALQTIPSRSTGSTTPAKSSKPVNQAVAQKQWEDLVKGVDSISGIVTVTKQDSLTGSVDAGEKGKVVVTMRRRMNNEDTIVTAKVETLDAQGKDIRNLQTIYVDIKKPDAFKASLQQTIKDAIGYIDKNIADPNWIALQNAVMGIKGIKDVKMDKDTAEGFIAVPRKGKVRIFMSNYGAPPKTGASILFQTLNNKGDKLADNDLLLVSDKLMKDAKGTVKKAQASIDAGLKTLADYKPKGIDLDVNEIIAKLKTMATLGGTVDWQFGSTEDGGIQVHWDITYRRNTTVGAFKQYSQQINWANGELQSMSKYLIGLGFNTTVNLMTKEDAIKSDEYAEMNQSYEDEEEGWGNGSYSEYESSNLAGSLTATL